MLRVRTLQELFGAVEILARSTPAAGDRLAVVINAGRRGGPPPVELRSRECHMRELEHGHDSASIRRRLAAGPPVSYLRDWVYGGIDGAVTTFAIVAGTVGTDLSLRVVLVLGAANLVGDGFSMAAGDFSATKAERDEYAHLRAVEERHVDLVPEGEREEIRQIYRAKGFRGEDLERAVGVVTASRERWIDAMMAEEHGLPKALRVPWRAALGTFGAFSSLAARSPCYRSWPAPTTPLACRWRRPRWCSSGSAPPRAAGPWRAGGTRASKRWPWVSRPPALPSRSATGSRVTCEVGGRGRLRAGCECPHPASSRSFPIHPWTPPALQ
jgi:hypothetical protein